MKTGYDFIMIVNLVWAVVCFSAGHVPFAVLNLTVGLLMLAFRGRNET